MPLMVEGQKSEAEQTSVQGSSALASPFAPISPRPALLVEQNKAPNPFKGFIAVKPTSCKMKIDEGTQ